MTRALPGAAAGGDAPVRGDGRKPGGVPGRRTLALAFAAIALVAVGLRAAHARQLARNDILARAPMGDERTFAEIAKRVARGEDDQVPYQAPLYPTLLGGLTRVLGRGSSEATLLATTRALQALLGLGAAALAAALALRLTGRGRAAVVAFALTALARPLIHAEGTLLREAASTTLLAALALAYAKAQEGAPSVERHAALGLALGLGLVLRENFAVVAAAVLVERAFALGKTFVTTRATPPRTPRVARGPRIQLGGVALCLVLGVALPLLPFDVKVARLGDGLHVLPHWNSGCVFYLANRRDNPSVTGYTPPPFVAIGNPEGEQEGFRSEAERRARRSLAPHEVSSFWLREGLSEMRAAPGLFAERVLERLVASVAPWEMAHQRDPDVDARFSWVLRAPLPGAGALLVLAALGLGAALVDRRSEGERALWIVLGSWWLSLVVAAFTTRYRVPALPLLAVAGARGLVGVERLIRARRSSALAVPLGFALAAAILVLFVLPTRRVGGDPGNAVHARGLASFEAGEFEAAGEFLDEASRLQGDTDPQLLLLLGRAWLKSNRGARAWGAFALAREHGAASDEAVRGLAIAELELGRPSAAAAFLETALAHAPGDRTLEALLARARKGAAQGPDRPFPSDTPGDPRRLLR